jgi:hypothetical protein
MAKPHTVTFGASFHGTRPCRVNGETGASVFDKDGNELQVCWVELGRDGEWEISFGLLEEWEKDELRRERKAAEAKLSPGVNPKPEHPSPVPCRGAACTSSPNEKTAGESEYDRLRRLMSEWREEQFHLEYSDPLGAAKASGMSLAYFVEAERCKPQDGIAAACAEALRYLDNLPRKEATGGEWTEDQKVAAAWLRLDALAMDARLCEDSGEGSSYYRGLATAYERERDRLSKGAV